MAEGYVKKCKFEKMTATPNAEEGEEEKEENRENLKQLELTNKELEEKLFPFPKVATIDEEFTNWLLAHTASTNKNRDYADDEGLKGA